ncbi:hypothetical protein [Pseudomonas huaxiensis]|uniref:hypothetical protein n=1 Tax=Pseudomonas huaxiensis TaxID=2213017 RepID=UPI0013002AB0|nr:hypothetical protein [Pseudomonas huaxiensis]
MIQFHRTDIVSFCLISLIVPLLVLLYGDAMYAGLYYYFVIPAVALPIAIWFSPRKGFLIGLGIALAIEFLLVLQINWRSQWQDGMVGVLHMVSLPGAFLAVVFAGRWFERKPPASSFGVALTGCVFVLVGCTLMQTVFYLFFFVLEKVLIALSR